MLNKLYEQGKDLHVANYVAYGKTADHKLYADEGYKETATKAEIEDAFVKGRLVIVEGANYLVPVAFGATGVITVVAGETVKTQAWAASVYSEIVTERDCYGDLTRNMRRNQSGDKVNDDISLANTLSVIADPYVQEHFCNLRYVTLYGGKWKVTDASVEYPRIVLTLGGLWHGNETE